MRSSDGAEGEGGGQGFDAELGDGVDLEGDHSGGQSWAEAGGQVDQRVAVLGVMDQDDGVAASGVVVGQEKGAQAFEQRFGARQGVGGGSRGADGGAGTAAGADERVDGDVVAVRRDGSGRADVQAAGAAGLLVAGMGAQLGAVIDVAGLVEFSDQIGELEDRLLDFGRVAGVGAEIAVALAVGREQRRAAGQVEDDVAGGFGSPAGRAEGQGLAATRGGGRRSRRPRPRTCRGGRWP